jgi:PadR family transcriptional regulator PadR
MAAPQLLQGTLDVMILSVLAKGSLHGYAIARAIERESGGALVVEEGSLYPALKRLSSRGDIEGMWVKTETGRRGRIYALTPRGERERAEQALLWKRVSVAVGAVLAAAPQAERF